MIPIAGYSVLVFFILQALQGASSKEYIHTGTQQDVSEFTHKLLEWIENAFKLSLESNPSDRSVVLLLAIPQYNIKFMLNFLKMLFSLLKKYAPLSFDRA